MLRRTRSQADWRAMHVSGSEGLGVTFQGETKNLRTIQQTFVKKYETNQVCLKHSKPIQPLWLSFSTKNPRRRWLKSLRIPIRSLSSHHHFSLLKSPTTKGWSNQKKKTPSPNHLKMVYSNPWKIRVPSGEMPGSLVKPHEIPIW